MSWRPSAYHPWAAVRRRHASKEGKGATPPALLLALLLATAPQPCPLCCCACCPSCSCSRWRVTACVVTRCSCDLVCSPLCAVARRRRSLCRSLVHRCSLALAPSPARVSMLPAYNQAPQSNAGGGSRPEVRVLQQQVQAVRSGPPKKLRGAGPAPRGEDTAYKIAILGPLQAGKTKIAAHIVGNPPPTKYEPTAGVRSERQPHSPPTHVATGTALATAPWQSCSSCCLHALCMRVACGK